MGVLEAPAGNSNERVPPSFKGASPDTGHQHLTDQQADKTPILVHCHLRWDFVWQRPQQVFSRLSQDHAVLFLEEGGEVEGGVAGEARLELSEPARNLVRAVPCIPGFEAMSVEARCEIVLGLLRDAKANHPLVKGRFDRPVQWFYSPMTAPFFMDRLESAGIVYDCMDELANFRFAHAEIAQREKLLLSRADVVFTGGYQLYESKSRQNANTHFFGCGVDVGHFGKARLESTVIPPEVSELSRPIFGYFGVIDERLDYNLIARLARDCPHASIVMVGPIAKVDPAALPRLPNIHWLGQRAYADLPSLVKAFDVCLMPFALNEATQYINPTKTLEYMATAKPIVSTAVPDVVRNFTPIVRVAHCESEFVRAVQDALADPDQGLIQKGVQFARESSWEAIVGSMRRHMVKAISPRTRAPSPLQGRAPRPARPVRRSSARPLPLGDPKTQAAERMRAATGRAE